MLPSSGGSWRRPRGSARGPPPAGLRPRPAAAASRARPRDTAEPPAVDWHRRTAAGPRQPDPDVGPGTRRPSEGLRTRHLTVARAPWAGSRGPLQVWRAWTGRRSGRSLARCELPSASPRAGASQPAACVALGTTPCRPGSCPSCRSSTRRLPAAPAASTTSVARPSALESATDPAHLGRELSDDSSHPRGMPARGSVAPGRALSPVAASCLRPGC